MFWFHTHVVWINRSDGAENFTKRLCFRDVEDKAINKSGNSGITVDVHNDESIRPCCGIRHSVAGNSDLKNRSKICNAGYIFLQIIRVWVQGNQLSFFIQSRYIALAAANIGDYFQKLPKNKIFIHSPDLFRVGFFTQSCKENIPTDSWKITPANSKRTYRVRGGFQLIIGQVFLQEDLPSRAVDVKVLRSLTVTLDHIRQWLLPVKKQTHHQLHFT